MPYTEIERNKIENETRTIYILDFGSESCSAQIMAIRALNTNVNLANLQCIETERKAHIETRQVILINRTAETVMHRH